MLVPDSRHNMIMSSLNRWVAGICLVASLSLLATDQKIVQNSQIQSNTPNNDMEFDHGSGLTFSILTPAQIENLTLLGRVWGFLKYHHPRIVDGELHWDYELIRTIEKIQGTSETAGRNRVLLEWVRQLGEPASCDPCVDLPKNTHLTPRLDWINDKAELGTELSAYLKRVYVNRKFRADQFYVGKYGGPTFGTFTNESEYAELSEVDGGFRLLALFRYWNIIEYWFPYYDVIGEPWEDVLRESIPRFAAADNRRTYALELRALIARIHDSHAGLWSAPNLPPYGDCVLPVGARFVQHQAIVSAFTNDIAGPETGLEIGDTILAIDGKALNALIHEWSRYYPWSNETALLRLIGIRMTRGPCEETTISVSRENRLIEIVSKRIPVSEISFTNVATHDLAGDAFQMLSDKVVYLKLSNIKASDVSGYIDAAQGALGLIVDIRNYPSEFVAFELGQRMVHETTPFAHFTYRDLGNPGVFLWTPNTSVLVPIKPVFDGRVIVLVDEITQSQAEYTAMALQAGPNTVVVGSTTAAANGDIAYIPIPGGMRTAISGAGVFYPDKSPTQRIGIVPDIFVMPTAAGIRQGRDEVLERALAEILDSDEYDTRETPGNRFR